MKKTLVFAMIFVILLLTACNGQQNELINMESTIMNDLRCVIWENRTYVPFCVVSKKDCGKQIGYVDGNEDDRVSEYKEYPSDEWLVSWMPMDGGAMLLKEENVIDIPDGLEKEY